MKTKTKLLALLLTLVMLFCTSCDIQGIVNGLMGGDQPPIEEPTGTPHTCESVCGDCGKCTDKDCTETACVAKCGGHTAVLPPVDDDNPPAVEDGKHLITFVTNGGSAVENLRIEDGKRITSLPDTRRDGYKFLGWFTDEACTTKWKNSTKVTAPVTLYAGWKELYVFDREANSTSVDELLAMYTATPEEFEAAKAIVAEMKNAGMTDIDAFEAAYEAFEVAFYHLAEQMNLASIIYYCDMKNEESDERNNSTSEMFRELQDAYNVALQELLVGSPYADQLFEGWSEEEKAQLLNYSSDIMAIRNQIDDIEAEYDKLDENQFDYAEKVVEYYKQIVVLNNQLAAKFGYDNYYDYATEQVYGRDYTAEDLQAYHGYVKEYIATDVDNIINAYRSNYQNLSSSYKDLYSAFSNKKFDSMEDNYVMLYLESLGDTNMGVAMRDVFESENCVFANSGNSHPTAFQTWLYESEKPFCLFGSSGQSSTTIIHEIGHYYAAYTNDDIGDYDLCETHSQSNEFLFMQYCSTMLPKSVYNTSVLYQLANTYLTICLAAAVDEFEQRVYSLSNEEIAAMTVQDFDAIMSDIAKSYGGVLDSYDPIGYWKQVAVRNPVYYISYSVSAIASINLYAMATSDIDAAYEAYIALVETPGIEDMGYVEALTAAGIVSPFTEEAHRNIKVFIKQFTQ